MQSIRLTGSYFHEGNKGKEKHGKSKNVLGTSEKQRNILLPSNFFPVEMLFLVG